MKNKSLWSVLARLCGLGMLTLCAMPSGAQMSEVKEKPPMYTYIANWQIPRAQWAEMAKESSADHTILDKALAEGTIVGYGDDENLVHQPDGETHDGWWSAMSMAGLIKVLDQFYASGNVASPALASATKHWDSVLVSRYYNWHSGSWKGGYIHVSTYKLKAEAPDDAVDVLSKQLVVPLMEKMLADGTVLEYEVDDEAIHTQAPGKFWIVYVASNAEGLDKVDAAIRDTLKEHPLSGPAFGSMVDYSDHRDELVRGNGVYK
jgi:basic membrane lipoprotein Med (substrate-binding protein (PBP1-ABC) superfamily)